MRKKSLHWLTTIALTGRSRPDRKRSLLKPDDVPALNHLSPLVTAYRAHRPGEVDWIAYTLKRETACRFARECGADQITRYAIPKRTTVALFLRRGEHEVLALHKTSASATEVIHLLR